MRNVKRVLERYHKGELSVYDVARALRISLLHAQRLINTTQAISSQESADKQRQKLR